MKAFEELASEISRLRKELEGLNKGVEELAGSVEWIRLSDEMRLREGRM